MSVEGKRLRERERNIGWNGIRDALNFVHLQINSRELSKNFAMFCYTIRDVIEDYGKLCEEREIDLRAVTSLIKLNRYRGLKFVSS